MSKVQYDLIADEYSQMLNPTKKYVLIPTFKKLLDNIENISILDLACGDGFFTRILANLNPNSVLGIDISKNLIRKAKTQEIENQLNIIYEVQDVLKLNLNKKFDLITAVYLLNYAKNENELLIMCKNIFNYLSSNGYFKTITINPLLKPMANFEYERKFTNNNKKILFENGDKVKLEIKEEGKTPFTFYSYYWSKKTYEKCFKQAGFKSITWVSSVISNEGINQYGEQYWDKLKKNHSTIGIICKK